MLEAWFRLMTEAMRGSSEAQEAFRLLTGASKTQDDMTRWMTRFMPAAAGMGTGQPEMFGEWVEEWWKVMGVVPRHRYLELLERHEDVRRRLEDCEKRTRSNMPNIAGMAGNPEEAQKAMNMWGTAMEDMLKMQSQWMQTFFPHQEKGEGPPDTEEPPPKSDPQSE